MARARDYEVVAGEDLNGLVLPSILECSTCGGANRQSFIDPAGAWKVASQIRGGWTILCNRVFAEIRQLGRRGGPLLGTSGGSYAMGVLSTDGDSPEPQNTQPHDGGDRLNFLRHYRERP